MIQDTANAYLKEIKAIPHMNKFTCVLAQSYERIKKKVMEMSLEDLRDYVIYQMIEDENKYDPNYDDEEFFDW